MVGAMTGAPTSPVTPDGTLDGVLRSQETPRVI